jgi:hypothetical protein
VTRRSKRSRNCVAHPLPVKPMLGRRFRPGSAAYRPRSCTRHPSVPPPAMASGVGPGQARNPTRWSTRSTGPWPRGWLPGRRSSTSTAVSSWPRTNSTPPNCHHKRCWTATKARCRRRTTSHATSLKFVHGGRSRRGALPGPWRIA